MLKTRPTLTLAAALLGVAALTACSAPDAQTAIPAAATQGALPPPAYVDEEGIEIALGDDDLDGYITFHGERCEYALLLTTPTMIQLYAEAGDDVATNPSRSLGVKVISDGAACHDYFTEALAEVAP